MLVEHPAARCLRSLRTVLDLHFVQGLRTMSTKLDKAEAGDRQIVSRTSSGVPPRLQRASSADMNNCSASQRGSRQQQPDPAAEASEALSRLVAESLRFLQVMRMLRALLFAYLAAGCGLLVCVLWSPNFVVHIVIHRASAYAASVLTVSLASWSVPRSLLIWISDIDFDKLLLLA